MLHVNRLWRSFPARLIRRPEICRLRNRQTSCTEPSELNLSFIRLPWSHLAVITWKCESYMKFQATEWYIHLSWDLVISYVWVVTFSARGPTSKRRKPVLLTSTFIDKNWSICSETWLPKCLQSLRPAVSSLRTKLICLHSVTLWPFYWTDRKSRFVINVQILWLAKCHWQILKHRDSFGKEKLKK